MFPVPDGVESQTLAPQVVVEPEAVIVVVAGVEVTVIILEITHVLKRMDVVV